MSESARATLIDAPRLDPVIRRFSSRCQYREVLPCAPVLEFSIKFQWQVKWRYKQGPETNVLTLQRPMFLLQKSTCVVLDTTIFTPETKSCPEYVTDELQYSSLMMSHESCKTFPSWMAARRLQFGHDIPQWTLCVKSF